MDSIASSIGTCDAFKSRTVSKCVLGIMSKWTDADGLMSLKAIN